MKALNSFSSEAFDHPARVVFFCARGPGYGLDAETRGCAPCGRDARG